MARKTRIVNDEDFMHYARGANVYVVYPGQGMAQQGIVSGFVFDGKIVYYDVNLSGRIFWRIPQNNVMSASEFAKYMNGGK